MSAEGKGFDKALARGLRKGTEKAVGATLGEDAALNLAQKNKELGQILTSSERAQQDAMIAGRKNTVTSVDGMLSTHQTWQSRSSQILQK